MAASRNRIVTEFDYGKSAADGELDHLNIRFEDIAELFQEYHPKSDLSLLTKAYIFSAKEHKGQVRHSGEPYLIHPLNVAKILAEMRMDAQTVAVGLLHDVVEDTLVTIDSIRQYFGKDVADLVDGVTKISQIEFRSQEQKQAENLRKLWLATAKDIRVILIKIADRLHNMSTLDFLSPAKQKRIARETLDIYVPIANRLGMGNIQKELQELCFKYLYPRQYAALGEKLSKEKKMSHAAIHKIEKILTKEMEKAGISAHIQGRLKSNYSIFSKIIRQGVALDEVYDYLAFRVITGTVADCYHVLGIIHSVWRPIPGRIKDFIAMPKPNNYRSLHTSVIDKEGHVFEIQIRTEWMDIIAQEGVAAHWRYKEGEKAAHSKEELEYTQWLRDLVQRQQEWQHPDEFIDTLKIDLYPDKVYCFTPKGEVRSFPAAATALDFAYAIHTEVGNQCVGAKINGRIAPLKTRLKNGDVVEILTRKGGVPKRDWLDYATTSRTLTKIKQFLNKEERNKSREIGEKILKKEMAKYSLNLKKQSVKKGLLDVASDSGLNTIEDIFVEIGFGKVSAEELLKKILPQEMLDSEQKDESALVEKLITKVTTKSGESFVSVRSHTDILTHLAKCCNPLPGEPIVGFITRGRGISIHTKQCPNVRKLMYSPERIISAEWNTQKDQKFLTRLKLTVSDIPGILARIANTIAEKKINIKQLESKSDEGTRAYIDLVAEIKNIERLNEIMNTLMEVEGVVSVKRVIKESGVIKP